MGNVEDRDVKISAMVGLFGEQTAGQCGLSTLRIYARVITYPSFQLNSMWGNTRIGKSRLRSAPHLRSRWVALRGGDDLRHMRR
jgi:hypothetical protein